LDSNHEVRNNTRFEHESPVTYKDLKTGTTYDAIMYNYSNDGLYFETDLILHTGDEIDIGIVNSPYSSSSGVYECYFAKIIRRSELAYGSSRYFYGYGAKFMRASDKESDDLRNGIFTRKHKRKTYSKYINFTTNNRFYMGIIRDISRTGIFIETKGTFSSAQTLMLAIPFSNKKKNVIVSGEVVRSNDEGFGVKFKSKVTN